jgi:hypothetical protein
MTVGELKKLLLLYPDHTKIVIKGMYISEYIDAAPRGAHAFVGADDKLMLSEETDQNSRVVNVLVFDRV